MSDKPAKTRKSKTTEAEVGTYTLEKVQTDKQYTELGEVNMEPVQNLGHVASVLGVYAKTLIPDDFGVPATPGSAGCDLSALLLAGTKVTGCDANSRYVERTVKNDGCVYLEPFDRVLIPTGVHLDIPEGYMVNIYPRSGSSLKKALHLNNSVAVIDSDYTGEIFVSVINASNTRMTIADGERIAQFIAQPVVHLPVRRLTSEPSKEGRGAGGFGSTGI